MSEEINVFYSKIDFTFYFAKYLLIVSIELGELTRIKTGDKTTYRK